jgi:uncharacterized DUF497 family protein
MTKWNEFLPKDFEYDFENDELNNHYLTFDEACQCFYNRYTILRNKRNKDRYKLIGKTDSGKKVCIIFTIKKINIVRIITGWEIYNG